MNTIAGKLFGITGNHKMPTTPQRDLAACQKAAARHFETLSRSIQPNPAKA